MKVILKVAYDGRAFAGFQRQSQAATVQGTLERHLGTILRHPVALSGAGRTDIGVHASGQVVAFTSPSPPSCLRRLCHSLNSLLDGSLTVVEAALLPADDPFHPRYSALSRSYSYYLLDQAGPAPARFWQGRLWALPQRLDLDAARQAAEIFWGEHDFSTFAYRAEALEHRRRRVESFTVEAYPSPPLLSLGDSSRLVRLSITANGFLRRMVRLLVAGVVAVASGRLTPSQLHHLLQARDPRRALSAAPADGLYLEAIAYQPDPFAQTAGTARHALAAWNPRRAP